MNRQTFLSDLLSSAHTMRLITDFPDARERGFWEGLPEELRHALVSRGEAQLAREIPLLTLSDYMEFSRNGNRTHFEDRYFMRRTQLTELVIAECAEDRGRFVPRILDLIWAILEETSWCLPAHNTYVRDTPALPIPDPERPVIDLFAAETAAILGLAEALLRAPADEVDKAASAGAEDEIDRTGQNKITGAISNRIDMQIRRRILEPYLHTFFWWMGDGEQLLCNWTSWITQNILLSLFTRREGTFSRDELQAALKQAAVSLDFYLDDYSDDGCCSEGIFYYGHSGLCLFGCLDLMNRITAGEMKAAWGLEKIRRIAAYPVTMYAGGGRYINYSDASPYAGGRSARDYLFALSTGNEAYAAFAAADFRAQDMEGKLLTGEQSLYCHLLQLSCWREMSEKEARMPQPPDAYYPDTGLMIARDPHFVLAAKAGGNGDIHNHNDIGSITLYLDEQPFLIDLGVETYSAKTFSDRRYEIWTMQSSYHNTVGFCERAQGTAGTETGEGSARHPGIQQLAGPEYHARDVRCGLMEDEAELSMEFSAAYGDARIRSCRRCVRFAKGTDGRSGTITVRDDFHVDDRLQPILTFMTYEKPGILKEGTKGEAPRCAEPAEDVSAFGNVVRIRIGDLGMLTAEGVSDARIEVCPIRDERLAGAWKHDCYRILLAVEAGSSKVVLTRWENA